MMEVSIATKSPEDRRMFLASHSCSICSSQKRRCDKRLPYCTRCLRHVPSSIFCFCQLFKWGVRRGIDDILEHNVYANILS